MLSNSLSTLSQKSETVSLLCDSHFSATVWTGYKRSTERFCRDRPGQSFSGACMEQPVMSAVWQSGLFSHWRSPIRLTLLLGRRLIDKNRSGLVGFVGRRRSWWRPVRDWSSVRTNPIAYTHWIAVNLRILGLQYTYFNICPNLHLPFNQLMTEIISISFRLLDSKSQILTFRLLSGCFNYFCPSTMNTTFEK